MSADQLTHRDEVGQSYRRLIVTIHARGYSHCSNVL
jgi:hypothetical protein